jgi:FkbM family methyltransferase
MPGLGPIGHAHFLHRAWRYRLRTERAEIAYLRSLDLTGRTAVDIGAHRGIFSYWMSKAVGPTGRVVAFEPQPEMIRQLHDFRTSFFWIKHFELVESGLSDAPGQATMRRVGDHTGGASIDRTNRPNTVEFTIPLTTLDAHFAAHPPARPIGFIKCDVEGHERAVFRGAKETLRRHRPCVLFECHDAEAAEGGVFRDFEELGYRGWFMHGRHRHPITQLAAHRADIDLPYLNYIFEPAA